MGTPPLAATVLEALVRDPNSHVVAAVTQPDQPKGRELKPTPSAVKLCAQAAGLPVLQPTKARDPQFIEEVRAFAPDIIVVAAYGQILPQAVLDVPRLGCLNVHTSLLPKYRGAAPIQWAILNGDAETGVTIMKMDAGLDTGGIVSEERTSICDEDDAASLHDRLATLGAHLLVRTLPEYAAGRLSPVPQPEAGSSYARKIKKEDGRLDWSLPARTLWNRVRGLTPWPGTYTHLKRPTDNVPLKVHRATIAELSGEPGTVLKADRDGICVACGGGALQLTELQREGGKRLPAPALLSGFPIQPGERFE
jgi:methionyl-tRNA formyltransferase